MKVDKFIDEILVGQIGRIQDIGNDGGKDCHYLSFTLICAGIEFLGACFDDHPFNVYKKNLPSTRFQCAIEKLFPTEYHQYAYTPLYDSLRCGLAHVALSKKDIGLTQEKESKVFGTKHLVKHSDGRLILVSETFFSDFVSGCEKLKGMIKKGELTNPKLHGDIFSVPGERLTNISSSINSLPASGSCASGSCEEGLNDNLKRIHKEGGKAQNVCSGKAHTLKGTE